MPSSFHFLAHASCGFCFSGQPWLTWVAMWVSGPREEERAPPVLLRMLSSLHLQMLWGPRAFLSATVGLQPSATTRSCFCCFQESPAGISVCFFSVWIFFLLSQMSCSSAPPSTRPAASALAGAHQKYQDTGPAGCRCPEIQNLQWFFFIWTHAQLLLLVTHAPPGH